MAKNKINDLLASLASLDGEAEFIPLIGKEEEAHLQQADIPESLPVLPVRNNVLFPGSVLPITLTRNKSIALIKEHYKNRTPIGVFAQRHKENEDPAFEDLYAVGTMANILKTLKMPDGSTTVIIQGTRRVKIERVVRQLPYMQAEVSPYNDSRQEPDSSNTRALLGSVRDLFSKVVKLSNRIPQESLFAVQNIESADFLIYFIAAGLEIDIEEKQTLLEKTSLEERAFALMNFLNRNKQMLELKRKIETKVEAGISKQQKEFFLNQQLKTIQEELGGSTEQEVQELLEKGEKKKWSPEVKAHFDKEVKKLQRTHSMSPDYSVQLNYLNVLVDLPWNQYSQDQYDLDKARKVLDKDHYGLEKVKERILSYMAVLQLRGDMKAPILCLTGPPGVGKTSLGKSIAKAMGRSYVRMSLGGLHDESEIRGHRKTYIGAMPGRIIQGMKKAGTSNPVFMLDEIDKISGMTINGDPSAALLELLDPEQNKAFHDNFIEVDYDLSHVLFIATANTLSSLHPALLDRMEIIEVPSYVMDEKVEICKRHLIPKQLKEHGMKARDMAFPEPMIRYLAGEYTRESGVRQLEKCVAGIVRERAKRMVSADPLVKKEGRRLTKDFIKAALGIPLYAEPEMLEKDMAGVVTGLAWTRVGGEVLFVEAAIAPGKGELSMTGNLGKVMQESATLALSYIKANARKLGISQRQLNNTRVFIHVPEGATPKDGPSAGIAIFTALVSAYRKQPVRKTVAMTGEITLRGQVSPIGGVREKLLAAKRAGITDVVLCRQNQAQVEDIPELYKEGLRIHYVEKVEDVLEWALA